MQVIVNDGDRRHWQFLAVLAAAIFTLAILLHAFSDLPREYSWLRTFELFWRAVSDRYFVVMSLVALLAAAVARGERPAHFFVFPDGRASQHWAGQAALTLSVLVLLALIAPNYSRWDQAALLPGGFLIFLVLLRRDLAKFFFGMAMSLLALALVSYVFTVFKSQLFVGRSAQDQWIIGAETWLTGHHLYAELAGWAATRPALVGFCDWVYYLFFHHIALTALFLFALGDRREQWRYVASLSLCYLLGGLSYYVLPAMGPAFFDPSSFGYLQEHAQFTFAMQEKLRLATAAAANGQLPSIETYAFLACMPSLHMAHESIMLFYSRRSSLMLLFSLLYWLASLLAVLVLGWHYLLDVFGGVLLAALVIVWLRRLAQPEFPDLKIVRLLRRETDLKRIRGLR